MTSTRSDLSLSRIELIILSRLSCQHAPSENDIAKTLAELALPLKGSDALGTTRSGLVALRDRRLVQDKRNVLTDNGKRALQASFDMSETPAWEDIHVWHLLSRALGLQPGTEETRTATKSAESVARIFLKTAPSPRRGDKNADKLLVSLFGLSSADLTLAQIRTEIAERFIRDKLKLIGPVTLATMRAHALAVQNDGPAPAVAGSKEQMLQTISTKLKEVCEDKSSLRRAIVRNWVYTDAQAHTVTTSRATPTQGTLAMPPVAPQPGQPTTLKPPTPSASLLETVRDIIPRVGSDGRFGPEKVFISALWHRLERDRGIGLSLDRFKTWLIDANREQQLDLVRADLVGAMDPKLVADSEIEDLGATFHFVIDRQAAHRRPHA